MEGEGQWRNEGMKEEKRVKERRRKRKEGKKKGRKSQGRKEVKVKRGGKEKQRHERIYSEGR